MDKQRTREEIFSDLTRQVGSLDTSHLRAEVFSQMNLEVLLDIRELLSEQLKSKQRVEKQKVCADCHGSGFTAQIEEGSILKPGATVKLVRRPCQSCVPNSQN